MKLLLISTDHLDHTIIVAIDGVRYEYWLRHHSYWPAQDRVKSLLRRGFDGRALVYLKEHSSRVTKLEIKADASTS